MMNTNTVNNKYQEFKEVGRNYGKELDELKNMFGQFLKVNQESQNTLVISNQNALSIANENNNKLTIFRKTINTILHIQEDQVDAHFGLPKPSFASTLSIVETRSEIPCLLLAAVCIMIGSLSGNTSLSVVFKNTISSGRALFLVLSTLFATTITLGTISLRKL